MSCCNCFLYLPEEKGIGTRNFDTEFRFLRETLRCLSTYSPIYICIVYLERAAYNSKTKPAFQDTIKTTKDGKEGVKDPRGNPNIMQEIRENIKILAASGALKYSITCALFCEKYKNKFEYPLQLINHEQNGLKASMLRFLENFSDLLTLTPVGSSVVSRRGRKESLHSYLVSYRGDKGELTTYI